MVRGTTPTFILTLDADLTDCNVYVTFKQGKDCGEFSMTKTDEDISVTVENSVSTVNVFLTQTETLKFSKGDMQIQVNWTFDNGKRACSEIETIRVDANLINGVLA